jgi:CheY-like chemotaxis protein
MFEKHWPVLIVDDEADVLEVTRLALRDVRVDGVPLKLYTAASKAEAISLMSGAAGPPVAPFFAVAFVDVVMETDAAGLELCDYVRNNLRNKTTQLYIRTGQAGVAPERSVIDRFDINGYFTKVETTQDKLYSLVKAGIRQHEFMTGTLVLFQILSRAIGASRAGLDEVMGGFADYLKRNETSVAIGVGGEVIAALGIDSAEAQAESRRLEGQAGTQFSDSGDRAVVEGQSVLFKASAGRANDDAWMLFRGVTTPSQSSQLLNIAFLKALAASVRAHAGSSVTS